MKSAKNLFPIYTLDSYQTLMHKFRTLKSVDEFERHIEDLTAAKNQLDKQSQAIRLRERQLQESIPITEECIAELNKQIDLLLSEDKFEMAVAINLQKGFELAKKQMANDISEYFKVQELVMQYDLAQKKLIVCICKTNGKLKASHAKINGITPKQRAEYALLAIDLKSNKQEAEDGSVRMEWPETDDFEFGKAIWNRLNRLNNK